MNHTVKVTEKNGEWVAQTPTGEVRGSLLTVRATVEWDHGVNITDEGVYPLF